MSSFNLKRISKQETARISHLPEIVDSLQAPLKKTGSSRNLFLRRRSTLRGISSLQGSFRQKKEALRKKRANPEDRQIFNYFCTKWPMADYTIKVIDDSAQDKPTASPRSPKGPMSVTSPTSPRSFRSPSIRSPEPKPVVKYKMLSPFDFQSTILGKVGGEAEVKQFFKIQGINTREPRQFQDFLDN